jgi:hypothetical protein
MPQPSGWGFFLGAAGGAAHCICFTTKQPQKQHFYRKKI